MTPEEARRLLDGTTPGPWGVEYDHDWAIGISAPEGIIFGPYYDQEEMEQWETGSDADLRLAAHAPDMAATIAGMRPEYMALNRADENGEWHQVTPWSTEWPFRTGHVPDPRFDKVVRRYVTTPEEA